MPSTNKPFARRAVVKTMSLSPLTLTPWVTGCAGGGTPSASTPAVSSNGNSSVAACTLTPSEGIGPFPLSGVLSNSAYNRKDITEGKTGVPMMVNIRLVDVDGSCAPYRYGSVYIWHCDKTGVYSGYENANTDARGQTYCRGYADTNEQGVASFSSIFPGWYPGRAAHIHAQVFLFNNTSSSATATTQLTFPAAIIEQVYATPEYVGSGNYTRVNEDFAFRDSVEHQSFKVTGSLDTQLTCTIDLGIQVG